MTEENKLKEELESKFGFLKEHITVKRERRVFADVPAEHFTEVFDHLVHHLKFNELPAVIGLDEGDTFGIIYDLCKEGRLVLNLKTHVSRENPVINTVTKIFPSADAYERELIDLFGIQVQGLPPGPRYPLPDNWPKGEYPLRKDWKGEMLKEETNSCQLKKDPEKKANK